MIPHDGHAGHTWLLCEYFSPNQAQIQYLWGILAAAYYNHSGLNEHALTFNIKDTIKQFWVDIVDVDIVAYADKFLVGIGAR
jgi:hypothetical protein